MKRIDEYVNEIYKEFDETDKDTRILIEETKSHLYDEVEDLKKQGISEEESIERAILNFGKENSVVSEMNHVLKKQNKFSKILIIVALVIFSIGVVFKIVNLGYEFSGAENRRIEKYENDRFYSFKVFQDIKKILGHKDSIDDNMKNKITELLDEFNTRTNTGLYYVSIYNNDNECFYEYNKDVPEESLEYNRSGVASGNGYWTIECEKTDIQNNYDSFINDKIFSHSIPYRLNEISNYLFALSWILICVSLLNNAYIKNLLSKEYVAFFTVSSLIILVMLILGRHTIRESIILAVGILMLAGRYYNKKYLNRKLNL